MAYILCIDTATSVCSVSLSKDGTVIAVKETVEEKAHASMLTVLTENIINEAGIKSDDLDAIAVSKGPGSYTGLRIGVSTTKGLCYGSDKPLIAVNTLMAMSNGVISENHGKIIKRDSILLCPMIDARRMEVFTAIYDHEMNELLNTQALIVDENSFSEFLTDRRIFFFGSGAEKCKGIINNKNAVFLEDFKHSSVYMSSLVEEAFLKSDFEDVAYFEPFYLKDFVITVPKRKIITD